MKRKRRLGIAALLGAAVATWLISCGGGGSGGGDGFAHNLYAANYGSGDVSVYGISEETGELTWMADVPAGTSPKGIAVDPSGRFAYVANSISNNVSVYTIRQSDGMLIPAGAPAPAGTYPYSVDVDPSGRFAYAANYNSNDLYVYTIDAGSGALTAGTPVPAGFPSPGYGPFWVTVSPSGLNVYAANYNSDRIFQYSADPATGALTALGTPSVWTGHQPTCVAVDPSGSDAYVTHDNPTSGTIDVYTIDAGSGALTFSTTQAMGIRSFGMDLDPAGQFAYVADFGANKISVYTVDGASGALSFASAHASAGTAPTAVLVDPSGRFVYAANYYSDSVAAFAVSPSTGALTPLGPTVPAGTLPRMLAVR